MRKLFFLLIIFSLFSASYQVFKGKFDFSFQEQEKEMTKYELEDSEFIISDSKNYFVADVIVKMLRLNSLQILFDAPSVNTPPPDYFG